MEQVAITLTSPADFHLSGFPNGSVWSLLLPACRHLGEAHSLYNQGQGLGDLSGQGVKSVPHQDYSLLDSNQWNL